ncbi:hypothetical protein [Caballeronia sp. S22]|uniref:hypothetical protein n=1 Tax=Caballeronia sp. S22 TaxID=3137182 RepID=UPI0035308D18
MNSSFDDIYDDAQPKRSRRAAQSGRSLAFAFEECSSKSALGSTADFAQIASSSTPYWRAVSTRLSKLEGVRAE